jgi:predicted transposase/invertase (TIGR01784 family)
MISKFLDPKNDIAFKRIFGTDKNKDILIHFLNDILEKQDNPIEDVTFLKTVQEPEIASLRVSIVDVLCTDHEGNRFIIEMQVAHERGFDKRALYYASKAYIGQREKGTAYKDLKEVIFLGITNFTPFPEKASWCSRFGIKDLETNTHDIKDIQLVFLQLPKFTKGKEDIEKMTMKEKWAYFFRYAWNTHKEELDKLTSDEAVLKRAYEELDRFFWSENELYNYDSADMKAWSDLAVEEAAYDRGLNKGLSEGLNKGLSEGRKEGALQKQLEIARNMLATGIDIETVTKVTGLETEMIIQKK